MTTERAIQDAAHRIFLRDIEAFAWQLLEDTFTTKGEQVVGKSFEPLITGDGDDDIRAARAVANGTAPNAPITAADRAAFAPAGAARAAAADLAPRGDPNAPQGTGSPLEPTAPSGNPLPGPAKGIENQYKDSPPEAVLQQSVTADRDSPKPYEKAGVYAPEMPLKEDED